MSESQPAGEDVQGDKVQYPTNHIVAVIDTAEQTSCALDGLIGGGFLESEIDIDRGVDAADRVGAGTGRSGLTDLLLRLAQSVGLRNAEMETKDRYEQALREGYTVIIVLAPTEERKDLASRIIRNCGGHFINFFGHLMLQRIVP